MVLDATASTMAELSSEVDATTGAIAYTITVKNRLSALPLRIVKTDETGAPLEGAAFTLVGGTIDEQNLVSAIPEGGSQAIVYANGAMQPGTYTLTETQAPDQYLPLDEPVVITVTRSATGIGVNVTGLDTKYWGFDEATSTWEIRVMNGTPNVELPSSGGPGTTLFAVVGATLMLAAGLGLLRRSPRNGAPR